jgi:acyl-CoA synthetase (AMP-forming)/AMP-acid ligase II
MFFNSDILKPLIQAAGLEPQKPVFYAGKSTYTARWLLNASKHLANQLANIGMKKDDVTVIAFSPGVDFITVMYATIMLRAKIAIIDPEMGPALYQVKFNQLQPAWAFVDTRLLLLQEHPVLRFAYFKLADKPVYFPKRQGLGIIGCGPALPLKQSYIHLKKLLKERFDNIQLEASPGNHDYLITYTSGTLAEPKGVLHSLNALNLSIKFLIGIINNKPGDVLGTYLPHFALLAIGAQLPVVLYNAGLSVTKKMAFFESNKITILFGPPSDFLPMIKYCEKHSKKLPATLNHIMLGSAPVHQSFLSRLATVSTQELRLTVLYGMTENLVVSTADGIEKLNYKGPGDFVGKPVEGVKIQIAEDGELLINSSQLYSRYFHLDNRDDFHATGDLAEIDPEGNILLMGRKKEMIIRRNTNIYPALYESTIKKIEGVDEAVMVGIYNIEKEDEDVYLTIEANQNITEKYIRDKIAFGEFQVEKEALPDHVVFMRIPRKGRQSKVDRSKIVALINAEKQ